ncbi:MAG TPA: STAS domain-containing protein [Phycisphaerae bacterium]|nr:STAS domain-containing protein [Phycisphaerae bacterium]
MTLPSSGTTSAARSDQPFDLRVEQSGHEAVVRLTGSCTMVVAGQLGECLLRLASESVRVIIIDMSGLDFIESTGLGGIVAGYLRLRRSQGELRIVAPAPAIRQLLELTRLTQLFTVHANIESARKAPPASR